MKYSKQHGAILEYVNSVTSHPTAEEVYNELRKKIPNISLGTVYRNLDKLSLEGKIKRIKSVDSKDRFDGNVLPHYHLFCAECGKIKDLYFDYLEELNKEVGKFTDAQVLSHETIFNVICPKCSK